MLDRHCAQLFEQWRCWEAASADFPSAPPLAEADNTFQSHFPARWYVRIYIFTVFACRPCRQPHGGPAKTCGLPTPRCGVCVCERVAAAPSMRHAVQEDLRHLSPKSRSVRWSNVEKVRLVPVGPAHPSQALTHRLQHANLAVNLRDSREGPRQSPSKRAGTPIGEWRPHRLNIDASIPYPYTCVPPLRSSRAKPRAFHTHAHQARRLPTMPDTDATDRAADALMGILGPDFRPKRIIPTKPSLMSAGRRSLGELWNSEPQCPRLNRKQSQSQDLACLIVANDSRP